MAKGKSGSKKASYASYKSNNTFQKNKTNKLTKLLKAHPNNKQLETALKSVSFTRKAPNTKMWSATKKYYTQLFAKFEKGPMPVIVKQTEKAMFQLGGRI